MSDYLIIDDKHTTDENLQKIILALMYTEISYNGKIYKLYKLSQPDPLTDIRILGKRLTTIKYTSYQLPLPLTDVKNLEQKQPSLPAKVITPVEKNKSIIELYQFELVGYPSDTIS